jgi:hypothetical protein
MSDLGNKIKSRLASFTHPFRNSPEQTKALTSEVLINEPTSYTWGATQTTAQPISYETLWKYVKASPEVLGLVSAIVDDILSDGYYFTPAEGIDEDKPAGRNRLKQAEEFAKENDIDALLETFLFDALITGDGYIYKRVLTLSDTREFLNELVGQLPVMNFRIA